MIDPAYPRSDDNLGTVTLRKALDNTSLHVLDWWRRYSV